MKVFMVGGTGLLGCAAARMFIDNGHEVVSVTLPPIPEGAPIPKEMDLVFGNINDMSDEEVLECMKGCEAFIFAAGIDERVEFPPPVYDVYHKYNIEPVERLLGLAKKAGVKNSVILGSYFSYFAKAFPSMELVKKHPYIRSRIDQEQAALKFADENMNVAILELPYIFGVQPGRKPVWVILIEQLSKMGKNTMYPRGGTTMVTVRQVAEAIYGATFKTKGGVAYPIGYYNLTWDEFLAIVHRAMGVPDRKIIHIPKFAFAIFGLTMRKDYKKRNIQGGIDPVGLADLMCMETFIDKKWCVDLGVTEDDIESAIYDSVKLSVDAFTGVSDLLDMKGE